MLYRDRKRRRVYPFWAQLDLDICRERPGQFECVAMAAGSNLDLLAKQTAEFKPQLVSIQHSNQIDALRYKLRNLGISDNAMPTLAHGEDGIVAVATHHDCEIVVTGIVGCAGLLPTVAAIKVGKDIALANKETLIAGGPVVVLFFVNTMLRCYRLILSTVLSFSACRDFPLALSVESFSLHLVVPLETV